MFKNVIWLLPFLLLISGCPDSLSPEERKARREKAFDLTGSYKTDSGSKATMTFDITNKEDRMSTASTTAEASGANVKSKNHILITLKRDRSPTGPEVQELFKLGIKDINQFRTVSISAENLTLDSGMTSEFEGCSAFVPSPKFVEVEVGDSEKKKLFSKARYCIEGTVNKGFTITGALTLYTTDVSPDGEGGADYEYGEVELKYTAKPSVLKHI